MAIMTKIKYRKPTVKVGHIPSQRCLKVHDELNIDALRNVFFPFFVFFYVKTIRQLEPEKQQPVNPGASQICTEVAVTTCKEEHNLLSDFGLTNALILPERHPPKTAAAEDVCITCGSTGPRLAAYKISHLQETRLAS